MEQGSESAVKYCSINSLPSHQPVSIIAYVKKDGTLGGARCQALDLRDEMRYFIKESYNEQLRAWARESSTNLTTPPFAHTYVPQQYGGVVNITRQNIATYPVVVSCGP